MIYDDNYIKERHDIPVVAYEAHSCVGENPYRFHNHFHRDIELLYVDEGTMSLQISGKNFTVSAGNLIIINPYEPHAGCAVESPYAHRCLDFDVSLLSFGGVDILNFDIMGFQNIVCADEKITEYFNLAYMATVGQGENCALRARGALLLLFSFLKAPVKHRVSSKEMEFSSTVRNLLEEGYAQDITSSKTAEKLSYDHSYFCRRFRCIFGCSFGEYLNMFRIAKAKEMLSKRSVASVAGAVGFTSLSYFSRVFKDLTGMTPSAYKKSKEG